SGHQIRDDPPFGKGRVQRDAGGEYGRLGICGQTELLLGSLKTELGQGKAEGFIRPGEDLPRFLVRFGEIPSHPHLLRALARKQKCRFPHVSLPSSQRASIRCPSTTSAPPPPRSDRRRSRRAPACPPFGSVPGEPLHPGPPGWRPRTCFRNGPG